MISGDQEKQTSENVREGSEELFGSEQKEQALHLERRNQMHAYNTGTNKANIVHHKLSMGQQWYVAATEIMFFTVRWLRWEGSQKVSGPFLLKARSPRRSDQFALAFTQSHQENILAWRLNSLFVQPLPKLECIHH